MTNTTDTNTNTATAEAAALYFISDERTDGATFVKLASSAPEWLTDAVREAHDGELPDDWRYGTCAAIVSQLGEYSDDNDAGDVAWQIAEQIAESASTSDLFAWIAEHPDRVTYCDDETDGMGAAPDSVTDAVRRGYFAAVRSMVGTLAEAIAEATEDDE